MLLIYFNPYLTSLTRQVVASHLNKLVCFPVSNTLAYYTIFQKGLITSVSGLQPGEGGLAQVGVQRDQPQPLPPDVCLFRKLLHLLRHAQPELQGLHVIKPSRRK